MNGAINEKSNYLETLRPSLIMSFKGFKFFMFNILVTLPDYDSGIELKYSISTLNLTVYIVYVIHEKYLLNYSFTLCTGSIKFL